MKIGDKINVEIDGILEEAEVISILEKETEEFVIYSVFNAKDDTNKLYASKLIIADGKTTLEDTQDKDVLEYILKLISHKVKSVTNTSKENIKKEIKTSSKKDDMITKSSFKDTKVTEKNMEEAINLMKDFLNSDTGK